jgi:hypothetical protein
MTNNTALVRSMIVYGICLPLAIIMGYLIADPQDRTTDLTLGIVAFLLILPLLLRWYHTWLIVVWNMSFIVGFLPGLFPWWVPLSCVGFAVAIGHYALNRERKFLLARSVSWSLVFLAIVVAVTAKFRGGLGFRALGDESIGAKRYVYLWVAVLGYFALISQRIPADKRKLYTTLFLLGSATQIVGDFGAYLGPLSRFLSIFYPGIGDSALPVGLIDSEEFHRFGGLAIAGTAIGLALVARYGIEGVLDLKKLWRIIILAIALAMCGFGGYRSLLLMMGLTLVLGFCFEGLLRSRLMPIAALGMVLAGGIIVDSSDHLPLPIQRCLTVLPLKLDPTVRYSAEGSSEWRLEIWKYLLPQVPHYLFLGKGLTFDKNDMAMYLSLGNQEVGGDVGGQYTLAADYHNGPLSVIIPFGIWGAIGFIWFLVASIRLLWANYKYGDAELHKTNTFLMCYFIARTIIFLVVFGGFYSDLFLFAGMIGFSISLNGGVAQPVAATVRPQVVFNRFRPLPVAGAVPALKRG